MSMPHWNETDRPSAGKLNELADGANAALDPSAGQNPPVHSKTLVEIFELTEDITYPDSGDVSFPDDLTSPPDVPFAENCKRIWLKNSTNMYIILGSEDETVYFPTITTFTQGDPAEFTTGDRVAAVWNAQSGRWEVVGKASSGDASIWVELKTSIPATGLAGALVAGQSATAHPRDWNGAAWVTDTDAGREFIVVDVRGVYRGRAINELVSPNDGGSIGRAVFNADSGQWEIRELTPMATMLEALVNEGSDVAHTDATFAVDGLGVMQPHGGLLPVTSIAAARNALGFPANDDAPSLVFWNEGDLAWDALLKPPLEYSNNVTSLDYNNSGSTHAFESKKTKSLVFKIHDDGEDSSWAGWHSNVLETFTVTVDGSTAGLTRSRENFYVQEVGAVHAEGAAFEYLDGTVCP